MMEVIAPEDGFVLETHLPLSRHNGLGRTDIMKEQKNKHYGRLHVFGPKEEVVIEPVQTLPRLGCGNESASRPYTPSKQILLCAAKSLEKWKDLTRITQNKNPNMSVRLHGCIEEELEIHNDEKLRSDLQRLNHETKIIEAKTESDVNDEKMKNSKNFEETSNSEIQSEMQKEHADKQNEDERLPESSDDDENNEQNDNVAAKRIAPLQLMGEFLKAIMEQKYSLAKKLCQMILIYEPENPEAKQFLPLIEQKLLLENECAANEDEETGEGSSDDSEEDTSNTDDSETESEESSEDSDKNA
uniref:Glutamate-rich protein 2 n=1 Tax=Pogona vitticeps TaxID=103695 RepID=A0ABM5EWW2_9SAUR